VIGIVAARLRERHGRPVVALAPAGDGRWRGSARSLPGVHIRDALAAVAAREPDLIDQFGGHAMAAGLTLRAEHLPRLAKELEAAVLEQTGGVIPQDALLSDGPLDTALLTLDLVERLDAAGPWGQGFAAPLFDDVFDVREARVVGADHLRLRLTPRGGSATFAAIAWRAAHLNDALPARLRVAYRPQVNEWRGERQVQLLVQGLGNPAGV
jgi:single-stranded-DNA-specific exonuclease